MPVSRWAQGVPLGLTGLRACLAPVLVILALYYPSRLLFGACLVVAFLSDVFDGIIARRLGVATPGLRRLDSAADTLFYLAAAFAIWHLYPQAITARTTPLVILVALELSRYLADAVKFGREASYHMWSAKVFGLALFAGCFSLLALGRDGAALSLAVGLGIVSDLEGLLITAILRKWKSDVPSFVHALRLRDAAPESVPP